MRLNNQQYSVKYLKKSKKADIRESLRHRRAEFRADKFVAWQCDFFLEAARKAC